MVYLRVLDLVFWGKSLRYPCDAAYQRLHPQIYFGKGRRSVTVFGAENRRDQSFLAESPVDQRLMVDFRLVQRQTPTWSFLGLSASILLCPLHSGCFIASGRDWYH